MSKNRLLQLTDFIYERKPKVGTARGWESEAYVFLEVEDSEAHRPMSEQIQTAKREARGREKGLHPGHEALSAAH